MQLVEMNEQIGIADQIQAGDDGSVVLINVFTIDPADEASMLDAWSQDAAFMRKQPGYISTQMHRAIGGSSTYVNYAVWESVESFRNAFTKPEFRQHLNSYPESTTVSPHLFQKMAVPGFCVS